MHAEERDSAQLLYVHTLFLRCEDYDECALAPVVILQDHPSNIYGVLEQHVLPTFLPQPDKFWKLVRQLTSPATETWRPRVYGVQLKMLQHMRLPNTVSEWAEVEQAIASLVPYLKPESNISVLLHDIKQFVAGVEQWWQGRKRNDSTHGVKRPHSNDDFLVPSKRSTVDPLVSMGFDAIPANDAGAFATGLMLPPSMFAASLSPHAAVMPHGLPKGITFDSAPNGNHGADNQIIGGLIPPTNVVPVTGPSLQQIIALNVGGKQFTSTLATLMVVEGSYFWKLAKKAARKGTEEFFIDRNGDTFTYVLDYLRCVRYGEDVRTAIPQESSLARALQREAAFYGLPGLEELAVMGTVELQRCDIVYVQTGYQKEGPALETARVDLMQRLNMILEDKVRHGFVPVERHSGVEIREMSATIHRNLYYNIILKRSFLAL